MPDLNRLSARIRRELWEKDPAGRSHPVRLGVRLAQIVYGIARKFADGQLTLWAMSLVYTTLLSLVPVIAVSFSVLKAFGVRDRLGPALLEFLAPLGEQGLEIHRQIMNFVENVNVGVLGALGIALLFYTVISLMQKVEQAFNVIWHVPNTRSLARRFSDYLSVILIGPVLIFAALGVTASVLDSSVLRWLSSMEPFGTLILVTSRLVPYVLICGAFAFGYGFLTNTHVRPSAALVGGLFASVLWYTTGVLFTAFVVKGSNYSAIYSSFAAAILFMIWLYIGWLIVLVGAEVAFYWQNPRYLDPYSESGVINSRRREQLAFEIMTLIGHAHYYDEPRWTFEALKNQIARVHPDPLARAVEALEKDGLILATADNPPAYVPARAIDTIPLERVAAVARGDREGGADMPAVAALMERIDGAIGAVLEGCSVRDLVLGEAARQDESSNK